VTDAIYKEHDGAVWATQLARGPWDPEAQHGGAPAALLMRAFERLDNLGADVQIARVTYELLRPVPLGELRVEAAIVRPGRRVQLLEASLFTPDGTEVVRARAVRVARAPVSAGAADGQRLPSPETLRGAETPRWHPESLPGGAVEIRMVDRSPEALGPGAAWFRLRIPVVGGEDPTPLQRLAVAADFPNGISSELPWADWVYINPDLTLYIEREPRGEWIGLDAHTRVVEGGVGVAQAVLYDEQGRVGRSLQSLYVAKREG
jgi:hypothetical protein